MAITLLSGGEAVEISAGRFEIATSMTDGVTIWVNYTKGNEASLDVTFLAKNSLHPSAAQWFAVSDVDESTYVAFSRIVKFTSTGLYTVSIEQPKGVDTTAVLAALTGGTTGSAEFYITTMYKYS